MQRGADDWDKCVALLRSRRDKSPPVCDAPPQDFGGDSEFNAKGYLLPDFCSGATVKSGRFARIGRPVLRVDELQQQTTDFLGLLLLNPISGTIDEMRAAPLSTSRGLHHLKSTGKLIHTPIALARNETRRHIDGAVGRANANLLDSKIRSRSIRDVSPSRAAV